MTRTPTVVLDTHAALWWTLQPQLLGSGAAAVIDGAERIGIPAIVFWEVALLTRKGRLELDLSPADWAVKVCSIGRVAALPMTADIAMAADSLAMHPDPADRFIVATALAEHAPLVTKDEALRALVFVKTIW